MRAWSLPLVSLISGCTAFQAATDPCFDALDDTPDACAGRIVVDPASDPPAFDVVDLASADPTLVSVTHAESGDPCAGGVGIWELRGFSAEDLPIRYGDRPAGTRDWVNPRLSPEGELIPLEEGEVYTVSFLAKSRFPGNRSGSAPSTWSAVFVAGDPDSALLWGEACL